MDFTGSATFVALDDGESLAFTVKPRPLSVNISSGLMHAARDHRRYAVRVQARAATGATSIVVATGAEAAAIVAGRMAVVAGDWADYEGLATVDLPTGVASTVWISANGGALDVDSVTLVDTGR